MPYVSGTVFREAFDDVPLVDDSQERRPPSAEFHQIPQKPGASRPPSGAGSSRVGGSGPGASRPPASPPSIVEADAAALFADDDEPKPRPTQAAEARYKPRPCPECDTVVPAGMSLCPRCGLDLDTGVRIEVEGEGTYDEDDEELLGGMPAGAPTRSTPFVLMMVGTLALMGSIVLLAASLFTLDGIGRIALAIVCAFGVYASIEFLRGKSAKPLLLAIALAAAVDVVGLIVLPLVEADSNVTIGTRINEEGEEVPVLARLEDRLDRTKVGWGIALLLAAGASGFLLTTTPVRRMFEQEE
jgi:hypothetical protein